VLTGVNYSVTRRARGPLAAAGRRAAFARVGTSSTGGCGDWMSSDELRDEVTRAPPDFFRDRANARAPARSKQPVPCASHTGGHVPQIAHPLLQAPGQGRRSERPMMVRCTGDRRARARRSRRRHRPRARDSSCHRSVGPGTLTEFVDHYHRERNDQGLENRLIYGTAPCRTGRIRLRPRLGGLLNY
jgi:hypothetical protein